MTLHAIVLQAPWAPLAAIGVKQYETRGFTPTTLHPGDDLAIVLGLSPDTVKSLAAGVEGGWHYGYVGDDDQTYQFGYCTRSSDEGTRGQVFVTDLDGDRGHHEFTAGTVLSVHTYGGSVPIEHGNWIAGDRILASDDGLVRCHNGKGYRITRQRPYGDFTPGRRAWPLLNPRPLPEPVPCPSLQPDGSRVHMQGVFALPDHIERAVRGQLATSRAVPDPGRPFPRGGPAPAASTSTTPRSAIEPGDRNEGRHPAPHDSSLNDELTRFAQGRTTEGTPPCP